MTVHQPKSSDSLLLYNVESNEHNVFNYGKISFACILIALLSLPVVALITYHSMSVGLIVLGLNLIVLAIGLFLHSSSFSRSPSFFFPVSIQFFSVIIGGYGIWFFIQGI